MGRSPGFGSTTCNLSALFRLGFPAAPDLWPLTLLQIVTRRPVIQKVRGHTLTVLPLFVGIRFQVLFHSPPGVLFTFPSRYLCAIGRQGVFSLGRWSSLIPTGFLGPRGTRVSTRSYTLDFAYGTLTLFGPAFQLTSAIKCFTTSYLTVEPGTTRNTPSATESAFYTDRVWAVSRSLAATWEIAFAFSSSGY